MFYILSWRLYSNICWKCTEIFTHFNAMRGNTCIALGSRAIEFWEQMTLTVRRNSIDNWLRAGDWEIHLCCSDLQNQIILGRMAFTSRAHKINYYCSTLKINQTPLDPTSIIHQFQLRSVYKNSNKGLSIGIARLHQVYKHFTKEKSLK